MDGALFVITTPDPHCLRVIYREDYNQRNRHFLTKVAKANG